MKRWAHIIHNAALCLQSVRETAIATTPFDSFVPWGGGELQQGLSETKIKTVLRKGGALSKLSAPSPWSDSQLHCCSIGMNFSTWLMLSSISLLEQESCKQQSC